MKVSKKDIQMLLGFVGVLAAVLVYLLYFKPTMEKVKGIEASNVKLEERIKELEELKSQKEFFLEETEKYSEKVDEIYAQFPEDIYAEDIIQAGIDMEKNSDVVIESFEIENPVNIYNPIACSLDEMDNTSSAEQAKKDVADAESGKTAEADVVEEPAPTSKKKDLPKTGYMAMQKNVSYEFAGDLTQFMRAMNFVNDQDNRDVISETNLSYDESTGLLSCEIALGKYYVIGRNLEYVPATFNVPTGTRNLFSTFTQSAMPVSSSESGESESAE